VGRNNSRSETFLNPVKSNIRQKQQGTVHINDMPPPLQSCASMVQPPGKCLQSDGSNGFVTISATFGGCMVTLTSGFDFQLVASY